MSDPTQEEQKSFWTRINDFLTRNGQGYPWNDSELNWDPLGLEEGLPEDPSGFDYTNTLIGNAWPYALGGFMGNRFLQPRINANRGFLNIGGPGTSGAGSVLAGTTDDLVTKSNRLRRIQNEIRNQNAGRSPRGFNPANPARQGRTLSSVNTASASRIQAQVDDMLRNIGYDLPRETRSSILSNRIAPLENQQLTAAQINALTRAAAARQSSPYVSRFSSNLRPRGVDPRRAGVMDASAGRLAAALASQDSPLLNIGAGDDQDTGRRSAQEFDIYTQTGYDPNEDSFLADFERAQAVTDRRLRADDGGRQGDGDGVITGDGGITGEFNPSGNIPLPDWLAEYGITAEQWLAMDPGTQQTWLNLLANPFELTAQDQLSVYNRQFQQQADQAYQQDLFNRFNTFAEVGTSVFDRQADNAARELEANRGINSRYGFSTYLDSLDGALQRSAFDPVAELRRLDLEQRAMQSQRSLSQATQQLQQAQAAAAANPDDPQAAAAVQAATSRVAGLESQFAAAQQAAASAGGGGGGGGGGRGGLNPFGRRVDNFGSAGALRNFNDVLLGERFNGLARTQQEGLDLLQQEQAHHADLTTRQYAGGLSNLDHIYNVQRLNAVDNPFAFLAFRRLQDAARGQTPEPGQTPDPTPTNPASPFPEFPVPAGLPFQTGGNSQGNFQRRFQTGGNSQGNFQSRFQSPTGVNSQGNFQSPTGNPYPRFRNQLTDPDFRDLYDIQLATAAPQVRGQDLQYELTRRQQEYDLFSNPEALGAFQYFQGGGRSSRFGGGRSSFGGESPPALPNAQGATRRNAQSFSRLPSPERGYEVGQSAARGYTPDDFEEQVRLNTPNPNTNQRRTRFSYA